MRYFIELSYQGKNYHGWQIQPDANSIQEELNKAVSMFYKRKLVLLEQEEQIQEFMLRKCLLILIQLKD